MINEIENLNTERVNEIARELAQYGLGIFKPHMHTEDGNIVPPENRIISFEQNLHVRFIPIEQTPQNAIAVGWRWNGKELEVCAGCCGPGDPHPINQ